MKKNLSQSRLEKNRMLSAELMECLQDFCVGFKIHSPLLRDLFSWSRKGNANEDFIRSALSEICRLLADDESKKRLQEIVYNFANQFVDEKNFYFA